MTDDEMIDVLTVVETVEQIKLLLTGKGAKVHGAVLAELLTTWLIGHEVIGDEVETERLRDRMLRMHIEHVRLLVEVGK